MSRNYLRDRQPRPVRRHPEAPVEWQRSDADHVADLGRAIQQHQAGEMTMDRLARRLIATALLIGGDETHDLLLGLIEDQRVVGRSEAQREAMLGDEIAGPFRAAGMLARKGWRRE